MASRNTEELNLLLLICACKGFGLLSTSKVFLVFTSLGMQLMQGMHEVKKGHF